MSRTFQQPIDAVVDCCSYQGVEVRMRVLESEKVRVQERSRDQQVKFWRQDHKGGGWRRGVLHGWVDASAVLMGGSAVKGMV